MRKYFFFLMILLANIGFNSAHASVAGCTSAGPYNVMTGNLCRVGEFSMWSRGEQVREFQQLLKNEGFLLGRIDGIYGPITDAAAERYYRICPPEPEGPHIMMKYRFCLPSE